MTRQLTIDRSFDLDAILDGTQDFRWCPWEGCLVFRSAKREPDSHPASQRSVVEYQAES